MCDSLPKPDLFPQNTPHRALARPGKGIKRSCLSDNGPQRCFTAGRGKKAQPIACARQRVAPGAEQFLHVCSSATDWQPEERVDANVHFRAARPMAAA